MSFTLNITHRTMWPDPNGPNIRRDEWLAILESDPTLDRLPDPKNEMPVAITPDGDRLGFSPGCVWCKCPSGAAKEKMIETALLLDAKVQGKSGEVYGEGGCVTYPSGLAPPLKAASAWMRPTVTGL